MPAWAGVRLRTRPLCAPGNSRDYSSANHTAPYNRTPGDTAASDHGTANYGTANYGTSYYAPANHAASAVMPAGVYLQPGDATVRSVDY